MKYWILLFTLLLFGCKQSDSVQTYFVEKSETKDFFVTDMAVSDLLGGETGLSAAECESVAAVSKLNVLAFHVNEKNKSSYLVEKERIDNLLLENKYEELMRIGDKNQAIELYCISAEHGAEEFLLFAYQQETGFTLCRLLGKNMQLADVYNILMMRSSSSLSKELQALGNLFENRH